MERRPWFRHSISPYSLVGLLHQMVGTVCTLLVFRWVAPDDMGVWQVMMLVEGYCQVARLGVINAMNREYPFLLGQGDLAGARRVVQTAQVYTAGAALLVTSGLLLASVAFRSDPLWFQSLLVLAVCAGANLFRGFLEATFRGGSEFARLAVVQVVGMALALGTLVWVAHAGYQGLLGRYLVLALISLAVCWALRPVRAGWKPERDSLRRLLVEGFPLFTNNYLTVFAQSLPRLAIGLVGGAGLLGLYAPVAALIGAGKMLPNVLGVYLLPRLNFEYGQTGSPRQVLARAWTAVAVVTAIMIPLAIVGWLVMPGLVERWLPAYAPGSPALRWAVIVAGLSGLNLVGLLFSTLKAWHAMFQNLLFLVVSNAVLSGLAVVLFPERLLVAMAAAQAVALALQAGATQVFLRRAIAALGRREVADPGAASTR